jgi:hypothetical protein
LLEFTIQDRLMGLLLSAGGWPPADKGNMLLPAKPL